MSADHPARALWLAYEPLHAVTYFAPECREAANAGGLRGFWMGYFAGRAAPMGAVEPGVVEATFFNFHPDMVRRSIPDAWTFASPDLVVEARREAAGRALRRISPQVDSAAGALNLLLLRVVEAASGAGRPLFAANRDLPLPDDPVESLWQLCTTLREHRGDGHVAALTSSGLDGCEAHVLFAASEGVDRTVFLESRGWSEGAWDAAEERLTDHGLLDDDGATERGRDLRREIERATDELSWAAFSTLADHELDQLTIGLGGLADDVVAADEIPFPNPMGLSRR